MEMCCYQCEQGSEFRSCAVVGRCGKEPDCAALQDIIVHQVRVLAWYVRQQHNDPSPFMSLIYDSLYATVTNVDFSTDRLIGIVDQLNAAINRVKTAAIPPCGLIIIESLDLADLMNIAQYHTIAGRRGKFGDSVAGLQELILYGIKGLASYLYHVLDLGYSSERIDSGVIETLAFLAAEPSDPDQLIPMALRVGELNYTAMDNLDRAHTETFGHPAPTTVRTTPMLGKAILVSGHNLHDLDLLLKQTADKDINVYTHGEMLPALAYPHFQRYPHLVGNYGGSWQEQQREFADFPGPILMTTNCIQPPVEAYADRIYTAGPVAWPGVIHIGDDKDFSPVIAAAQSMPGFTHTQPVHDIIIGFAHHTVSIMADQIAGLINDGRIRHIFLIGGCDGAGPGRSYFTELAKAVPQDCIIMTMACGKYRFNKREFGSIAGIPRLLDIGQCNDTYSAIRIALVLADKLNCTVNELPLSIMFSWYEQKAVSILLTMLYLGMKNIKLGPTLPAFITPDIMAILTESFNLTAVSTASVDLEAALHSHLCS